MAWCHLDSKLLPKTLMIMKLKVSQGHNELSKQLDKSNSAPEK